MLNYNNKTRCSACFAGLEAGSKHCPVCGYSDESNQNRFPIALPFGTVLMGRYVIGNVLGKGGFGITYLAFDLRDDKAVAIKEYLPDTLIHRNSGDTYITTYEGEKAENFSLGAEKFYEEAKTVSKFNGHPNVINVYEFFYENNTAYFVMEYIKGVDLKKYIVQHGGRLSEEETIKLLMPILDALIVVHSVGVLHRDISPDNIFVGEDGNVKLLDFGSARQVLGQQSKSLSVILKPGFAPLEQYQSRGKQGPWTDIYSLTATMYYCITGTVPDDCMNRVEDDSLVLPSAMGIAVSEQFEAVLQKGMAVKAADRYQSVFQLKGDMEILSGQAEAVPYEVKAAESAAEPIAETDSEPAAEPILESESTEKAAGDWQDTDDQPLVKSAPIHTEAENKKSGPNSRMKLIIAIIAACLVIIVGITTAAVLKANYIMIKGKLYSKNIARLDLSFEHLPYSDIKLIENMKNLTSLNLSGNSITDITLLKSLTNLTELYMIQCDITDITPLKSLTNLTKLDLSDNKIIDLTPLMPLTELRELELRSNDITDIAPLKSLINLTQLVLNNNNISDLTPLNSLINLTQLELTYNNITELIPLMSLTNLFELDLSENNISDLTPLRALTNLYILRVDKNNITDLSPLKSLTELRELELFSNAISDITPLRSLTNLRELILEKNDITDITPLRSLTNLTTLGLSRNNISDITPLMSLTNLTKLYLSENKITDITPLRSLTNLTVLFWSYNISASDKQKLIDALPDCVIHSVNPETGEIEQLSQ